MSPLALLLVLSAAVAHASWNVIAHGRSGSGLPFLWWGAVASTVLWSFAIPLTGGMGAADARGFWLGVAVSAVLHVAYMLVLQRGYAVGDLSTVYATARGTGPLLTVIVAVTLLGETLTVAAGVGVAAVIAGVVAIGFVDRMPPGSASVLRTRRGPDRAVVFGLLTGVAIAAYTVWDTHALRAWDASPVAYMVGCTALEVPILTVLMLRGRVWTALLPVWRRDWRRLLAFGVLSPLSYILVLTAITIAPVALVAPVREVSVVLVSLFGAFVLRETHPARRLAASALVTGGILLLAL
ncbi:EamA family transporter [Microbacterium sp.]|uniref:EamA family transporter n=1 Tax=Microbacterium sp. TaxID=51671 RepID=UPI003C72430F